MKEGYVRAYQESDAEIVAANLRSADRMEIAAHSGLKPVRAIRRSVRGSEVAVTICSGDTPTKLAAIFGCTADGCIWLLGTDVLTLPPLRKQFLKECRRYVDVLQDHYPLLHNVIDERNTVHIRWLRWMGFTFIRRLPQFGVENRPFMEFVRIKQ